MPALLRWHIRLNYELNRYHFWLNPNFCPNPPNYTIRAKQNNRNQLFNSGAFAYPPAFHVPLFAASFTALGKEDPKKKTHMRYDVEAKRCAKRARLHKPYKTIALAAAVVWGQPLPRNEIGSGSRAAIAAARLIC